SLQSCADRRRRHPRSVVRLPALPAQSHARDAGPAAQPRLALCLRRGRRHPDRRLRACHARLSAAAGRAAARTGITPPMMLATVAVIFVVLILISMPIVFALAVAGIAGLWLGGYPMQQLSSALVSGSQSWVLLAIPAFVFAGNLM